MFKVHTCIPSKLLNNKNNESSDAIQPSVNKYVCIYAQHRSGILVPLHYPALATLLLPNNEGPNQRNLTI